MASGQASIFTGSGLDGGLDSRVASQGPTVVLVLAVSSRSSPRVLDCVLDSEWCFGGGRMLWTLVVTP